MREIKFKYFNLFTTLRDLLYNIWVIFLAAVIGFCACRIYYSAIVVKTYTSTMTVAVNISGYTTNSTVSSMLRTIDIAKSFSSVLKSDALIELVEEDLGENIGSVASVQKTETNLIDISVTDTSPEKAYRALCSVYRNSPKLTEEAFSHIIVSVVESPNMPSTVSNTAQMRRNSVLWAAISALLCVIAVVVISYFRDTVKNVSDVDSMLEGKLFGCVRHINKRRSKIRKRADGLLLTNPLIPYSFTNSFRKMAIKIESLQRTRNIKSIILTSIAENEGKTTTSVNIALALAEEGKKVLLVDTDFKLPAIYKFFDREKATDAAEFGEYLRGKGRYEDVVRLDRKSGVYLACGKKQYRNSSEIVGGEAFKNALKRFESDFDVVIIDTPPGGFAVDAEILSEQTSAMLFVVKQDYASVESINDYLSNVNSEKLLGVIFNDVSEVGFFRRRDPSAVYLD